MSNLIEVINLAVKTKPKFGDDCNNCGYCCIAEVCPIGQDLTGSSIGPCKLLVSKNGKHYCHLAKNETTREALGIGTGCFAETQAEVFIRIQQ